MASDTTLTQNHCEHPTHEPRRGRLRFPSAVIVGCSLLLAVGSAGGAVAGSLVTGKQIKNGTVGSADIKNKTITRKDLARSALPSIGAKGEIGPPGASGAQGPEGPTGAPGIDGHAAWDLIPSGTSVTGEFVWAHGIPGTTTPQMAAVPLPGVAPEPLTVANVRFAPAPEIADYSADDRCTGTAQSPTAPAGLLCLYLGDSQNVRSVAGEFNSLQKRGFLIQWRATSSTVEPRLFITWAYTAP